MSAGIPTFGYTDNGDGSLSVMQGGGVDPFTVADNPYVRQNGTDLSGLHTIAGLESNNDYSATNPDPKSTATGKYQFVKSTAQHVALQHPYSDPDVQSQLTAPDLSNSDYRKLMVSNPGLQDHLGLHHYSDLMNATGGDPRTVSQMWLKGQYGDLTEPDAVSRGEAFDKASGGPPSLTGASDFDRLSTDSANPHGGFGVHDSSSVQDLDGSGAQLASDELPQQAAPQQQGAYDPWAEWEQAFQNEQSVNTQAAQHAAAAMGQKADLLDQTGKQLDLMGPPPAQKNIDPRQYYANIGNALGAKDPGTARLIGGIATGLFAGLGTLGAAIAHTHNDAMDVIQQGIQHNINAQNQNNQITRQQWSDQYGYILKQVQAKTDALAARAGSQEILDGAARTNAGTQLDMAGAMAKMSLLPPEAAAKNARLQSAQTALMEYEDARRKAFTDPRSLNAALVKRGLAIDELAKASTMGRKPSPEDRKAAESLLGGMIGPDSWKQDNLQTAYGFLRQQGELTVQSARGINTFRPMPSGVRPNNPAGRVPPVTPPAGAKPQVEEAEEDE
jgi:hypothetical protein